MRVRVCVVMMWVGLLALTGLAQTDVIGPQSSAFADDVSSDEMLVETTTPTGVVATVQAPDGPPAGAIDVKADELTYDRDTGWMEASGNVVILNGRDKITADYVQLNMQTQEAVAYGNVTIVQPSGTTTGDRLNYNFKTGQGHSGKLSGKADPFYWIADDAEQVATNCYVLHNAQVTTCRLKGKHRHFHVRARKLTVMPHEWMKAHHSVWFFGRVPVFYSPYWFKSLQERGCGWTFQPGYDSRLGFFMLSTYGCTLFPWLKTESHIDYYNKRGVGLGQDLIWHQPDSSWAGDLETYWIDDKEPWEPEEDPALSNVDPQRHRIRLRQSYYPSRKNYALLQAYHLSDPDVQEDFFEQEYRRASQPENYLIGTRRSDGYLLNVNVRKRLNTFYTSLERLPELSADVFRREIGDSRFYYEGRAAAGYLQWAFADDSSFDDISSLRADTYHRLYRPFRLFGFLNMIPRAGFRSTWYSETRPADPVVTETVLPDGTTTQTVSVVEDAGPGGTRSLYEVGQEVSFKAFRIWEGGTADARSYRHIVEPYVNYTYVVNSGLTPDDLYQFDRVDREGEEHYAVLGVRNMFQTKQGDRARDIIDVNVYTVYNLDTQAGEDPVQDIRLDAEIRPLSNIRIDLDAYYNLPADEIRRVDSRLWLWRRKAWSLSLENRYRKDSSSRWTVDGDWRANKQWRFGSFVRYEANDDSFETAGGYIEHDWDCIVLRTGGEYRPGYIRSDGTEREDEYRVTVEFWLRAFPTTRLRFK